MSCSNCGSKQFPCGCQPSGGVSPQFFGQSVDEINSAPCKDNTLSKEWPAKNCKVPYYLQTPVCEENHTLEIKTLEHNFSLNVANTWVIPECGGSAVIIIMDLHLVHIGSFLWNALYGYFEITAFDECSSQITVRNNCTEGNTAPGTEIPSCTNFVVTDAPCPSLAETTPFLGADFTAPNVGECIDITVTNTIGLSAGTTIEIGIGAYTLDHIVSNTTINICNDGSGIPSGTLVIAIGPGGSYQYPIVTINSSIAFIAGAAPASGTINSGGTTLSNSIVPANIVNPSATDIMQVQYSIVATVTGGVTNGNTHAWSINTKLYEDIDGGGPVAVVDENDSIYTIDNTVHPYSKQLVWVATLSVPPTTTRTIATAVDIIYTGAAVADYVIAALDLSICGIGILT